MGEYQQILSIVNSISQLMESMTLDSCGKILNMVTGINKFFYRIKKLKVQHIFEVRTEEELHQFKDELKQVMEIWNGSLQHIEKRRMDREFWMLYECFYYGDPQAIKDMAIECYMNLPEKIKEVFHTLPEHYTFLDVGINELENDFSLIERYIAMMTEHVGDYRRLYEMLADNRSKSILNSIVKCWLDFNFEELNRLTENIFYDYFDLDILDAGENDVIVDCGAFIGDTIGDFISCYGRYKKIYAYEVTPSTYNYLVQSVQKFENVECRQKGVGRSHGKMYLDSDKIDSGNSVRSSGDVEVEIVSLDEDIAEPISIIKMDVEGAEQDALRGAKKHIINEKPKLLISAYHLPADIFEIPFLIADMRDDYRFYLRYNGHSSVWPCDFVLFAV